MKVDGQAGAEEPEIVDQKDVFNLGIAVTSDAPLEDRAMAAADYLAMLDNLGHFCDFRHADEARNVLGSYDGSDPALKRAVYYYVPEEFRKNKR